MFACSFLSGVFCPSFVSKNADLYAKREKLRRHLNSMKNRKRSEGFTERTSGSRIAVFSIFILTLYRPAMPFCNRKKYFWGFFSSVLFQFKKYRPSGNLTFYNEGILKSLKLLFLVKKILPISLKLNTQNTLGCKGLRYRTRKPGKLKERREFHSFMENV